MTKTREEPVYEEQTVTRTRWVQIFVPYDTGGGTVAGDGQAAGQVPKMWDAPAGRLEGMPPVCSAGKSHRPTYGLPETSLA